MLKNLLLKWLNATPRAELLEARKEAERLAARLAEEKMRGASLMNRLIETERKLQTAYHEASTKSFMALADQATILALRCAIKARPLPT